ncbi:carbohydrate ABC transporter permease [Labrys wisconsinensis]|uniref:Sorbitol/mannitol transport system permease protein n=1 Tax=Labrys wisconsinensis TaxID=425677 RepID=A0ABU0J6K0_9HYPH|nr:carbohydrate ABC transporter permease [Labrys wisconsinensis]MDQ0469260.1 sorbitol/mannitol transport system permease protein [Labrys wisconsinensis]
MRSSRRQIGPAALTFLVAGAMCFPILWTFFTGFKNEPDAIAMPPTVFVPLTLEHYEGALTGNYPHYLANTLIAVVGSILAAFALGLPAAYKLAFFPGRKANDILFFALSTRFMPGVAVIVPIFLLYAKTGLIDSLTGLVIMYTTLNIPIVIWLMRSFFKDIPYELVEAALMEGAGHRAIFFELVLPLAKAGLATTTFLLLILTWNEFFFAVNLSGHGAATLPVYMASFFTSEGQSWARMSAAAILAVLPVLAVGWIASRALIKGTLSGAVK